MILTQTKGNSNFEVIQENKDLKKKLKSLMMK